MSSNLSQQRKSSAIADVKILGQGGMIAFAMKRAPVVIGCASWSRADLTSADSSVADDSALSSDAKSDEQVIR